MYEAEARCDGDYGCKWGHLSQPTDSHDIDIEARSDESW